VGTWNLVFAIIKGYVRVQRSGPEPDQDTACSHFRWQLRRVISGRSAIVDDHGTDIE
jgi:hypothetical protein